MLVPVVVLFALVVLFGVMMARERFKTGHNPRASMAVLHGIAVAMAVAYFAYLVTQTSEPRLARVALVVMGFAALGGATMAFLHSRHRLLPRTIVLGHALLGVTAVALVLIAVMSGWDTKRAPSPQGQPPTARAPGAPPSSP